MDSQRLQTIADALNQAIGAHGGKLPGNDAQAALRALALYVRDPQNHTAQDAAYVSALLADITRLLDGSLAECLQLFDDLLAQVAGPLHLQVAILLARLDFADAVMMEDAAVDSFRRVQALLHADCKSSDCLSFTQWSRIGQFAVRFGEIEMARDALLKIQDLQADLYDAALLSSQHAALVLGASIASMGDESEAEQGLRQLLAFCTAAFGRDAEETVEAESHLGRLLVSQERTAEAMALLRHAATVRVVNVQTTSMAGAEALYDFAYCLDRSGDDSQAMVYYGAAYSAYRRLQGPGSEMAVRSAQNLAETARVIHDYETAERWFRVALSAEQEARGERSPTMAHILNNLGETLLALKRAEEAAPLVEQALAMREELFGRNSLLFDRSLDVAMLAALQRGDNHRSAELLKVAQEKNQSTNVPLSLPTGIAYCEMRGDYAQAIEVCRQAIKTVDNLSPRERASKAPDEPISLRFKLAELYVHEERWADARREMMSAFELETLAISDGSSRRSRRQIGLMLAESRARLSQWMTILSHEQDLSTEDLYAAYTVLQQRKGMETRLLRLQKPSFTTNPGLSTKLPEEMHEIRAEMSRVVDDLRQAKEEWTWALLRQTQHEAVDDESQSVLAWQDKVELLERQLASYVGSGALDWELMGIAAQAPAVPAGSAVVEYALCDGSVPAYYAFVLKADQSISMTALGDADSIHQALLQLRTQVIEQRAQAGDPDPAWRRRGRFLFNRLLKPLIGQLEGCKHLYVVPDADLFTLPFDLLPLNDDALAIDRWEITHLWHGGELTSFTYLLGSPEIASRAVVLSAPILQGDEVVQPMEWQFASLPFADREGAAVAEKIGATHLEGANATKDAVLASNSAEILHLATHSFYIPRTTDADGTMPDDASGSLLFRARSLLADPMERSGIALTGANRELNFPTATCEGILFGAQVLDMDLRGTDLAVLSSCQSGLGDPHPGDGIQGLRRAFRAAGARSVVSSLWKVPDEVTSEFMLHFYDHLLSQASRSESLRWSKLLLREKYENDPLFWAGFVLDGSPKPLARFDALNSLKIASFSGIGLSFDSAMEHMGKGEWDEAIADLQIVMGSATADDELRASAAYEHAGILRKTGRLKEALAAYDKLIGNIHTPVQRQRYAVADRGLTRQLSGDMEGAYADYTSAINSPEIPKEHLAAVLVNRSMLLAMKKEWALAIADCDQVLSNKESPTLQTLKALLNKAEFLRCLEKYPEALAVTETLIRAPGSAGHRERDKAYLIAALCHLHQGELKDAARSVRAHLKARRFKSPNAASKTINSALALARKGNAQQAASLLYKLILSLGA